LRKRGFLVVLLAAVQALATDLSGKWNFDVMLELKNLKPVVVFRQQGEKLEGDYGSECGLTGWVKGSKLSFRTGGKTLVYQGDIETAITLKGRILDGKKLVGAWTAEKQ
jgi:hypothetical protein